MQSARVDVFFSCSFKEEDKAINEYFISICNALDITCKNVDTSFSRVPPEVARSTIDDSQALIGIAVKRNDAGGDECYMPDAVHEEISMAYGMKTPVLLFVENGVKIDGMKKNYGTHLNFERGEIFTPEFLSKVVKAIHTMKLELLAPHNLIYDHDTSEFIAEHHFHLVEMLEEDDDFTWKYSSTRNLKFTKPYMSRGSNLDFI